MFCSSRPDVHRPVPAARQLRGGTRRARATRAGDRVGPAAARAAADRLQARCRAAGVLPRQARCGRAPDQVAGRRHPETVDPAVSEAFDLRTWSDERLARVEAALSDWVVADAPAGLGDAMRYAVLDGGKRLRPLLVLAASEAVGGNTHAALRAACAVELIHAYSLVHDDMPCMDNDVLRRGKPTVHVQFGEAQAMLAGDAMQALAFEVLTPQDDAVAPALQARLCALLARAAGHAGMAGGQAIDLASVGRPLDEQALRDMHQRKTGALLKASVLMGAACGGSQGSALDAL